MVRSTIDGCWKLCVDRGDKCSIWQHIWHSVLFVKNTGSCVWWLLEVASLSSLVWKLEVAPYLVSPLHNLHTSLLFFVTHNISVRSPHFPLGLSNWIWFWLCAVIYRYTYNCKYQLLLVCVWSGGVIEKKGPFQLFDWMHLQNHVHSCLDPWFYHHNLSCVIIKYYYYALFVIPLKSLLALICFSFA